MEIEQKHFDNLKQLDRIEYRQTHSEIEKENCSYELSNTFWYSMLFCIILASLNLLVKSITGNIDYEILNLAKLFLFICFFIFILDIITMILSAIRYNKNINKLNEKYFKIGVKK